MANNELIGIQLTPDFVQIFLNIGHCKRAPKQVNLLHDYCNEWKLSVNTVLVSYGKVNANVN